MKEIVVKIKIEDEVYFEIYTKGDLKPSEIFRALDIVKEKTMDGIYSQKMKGGLRK